MARSVVLNGTTYSIPQTGEDGWSSSGGVDDFLVALATGVLSKAGGTFTLTAEIDLGATYGIKGAYWKSKATNPAAAGAVRLGNTETVSWRNAGNSADLALTVNASDQLTFGGVPVAALSNGAANTVLGMNAAGTANEYKALTGTSNQVTVTHGVGTITLATPQSISTGSSPTFAGLTLTSFSGVVKAAAGVLSAATLVNADVDAAAAIAYSKLNLAGSVTNADLAGSIAYSKLVLTGSILNADLAGSIADTKLSTIATAGKVSNSATTATSSNTNSTIVARDGSGNFSAGTITAALSGNATTATSVSGTVAIANGGTGQTAQTAAFDALAPNTTKGDLIVRGASNNVRLAVGTNGQVLTADSTATNGLAWGDASAGAGEINAVSNPSAASATTGWAAGTSHSVARDTSNSPLNPAITTCLAITATANAVESSTSGVGYTISTFPAGLRGRKNKVEFWITSPSADTWKVSVYTAGGTRMALSTDSSSATTITAGVTGKFTTTFDADATTTSYIVRFTRTAGTGTTLLYTTNLVVGPGIQPQGAGIGAWQSYTPVITGVTTSAAAGRYRRIGDSIEISGTFTASGTSTTNVYFPMPSGLTIAAGAGAIGSSLANTGSGTIYKGSSTDYRALSVYPDTTTNLGFVDNDETGGIIDSGDVVSGNVIGFTALVAVNEYAGSGTVNLAQNDIVYYYGTGGTWGTTATITTAQGPGGVLGGTTTPSGSNFAWTFTPTSPIPAGAKPTLSFSIDGVHFYPPGGSQPGGFLVENLRYDGTNIIGASVATNSSGQIVVTFGKYAAGTSSTWNTTWYWRVEVGLPGQTVGFAEVVPGTSSGLVSASGLKGNSGTTVAAGYVGEVKSSTTTTAAYTASALFENITTLSMTAGTWWVSATVVQEFNNSTSPTNLNVAVSGYSGNTTTDHTNTLNNVRVAPTGTNNSDQTANLMVPVRCDGTNLYIGAFTIVGTTLYLKSYITYTGTAPKRYGSLVAVRIA